ncbi:MAG: hypothetical protein K0R47_2704 [Brevibacillus sp.]|jgi:hypothetical protein|nr:hypothetical protein [Brevibacillus sp.]
MLAFVCSTIEAPDIIVDLPIQSRASPRSAGSMVSHSFQWKGRALSESIVCSC